MEFWGGFAALLASPMRGEEEVEHMQRDHSQSPDVVERIGIVIWKIAVLLIALRCILALIPQHGVLDGLRMGGMVLQGCALMLMTAGGGWAIIRVLRTRAPWPPRPYCSRSACAC